MRFRHVAGGLKRAVTFGRREAADLARIPVVDREGRVPQAQVEINMEVDYPLSGHAPPPVPGGGDETVRAAVPVAVEPKPYFEAMLSRRSFMSSASGISTNSG